MLKIQFEFLGGPHDGRILEGTIGDASDAELCFLSSNWGTIGQGFNVASQYAAEAMASSKVHGEDRPGLRSYFYAVTDCLDESGEVWVRAAYDPQHDPLPGTRRV
jgi:hypothetical protein